MDHKEFQKYNSLVKKNINVFEPNLTSNLSLLAAEKNIKKNSKFLDLGCGNGILGIILFKKKKIKKVYASDVSKYASNLAKKNMIKNKVSYEVRCGSLFDPWKDIIYQKEKFDYILNDVSAISSLVAKKSSWFNDKIPCEAGKDGTKLTVKIIKKSLKFLKKKGILQIPILSLSNRKKILKEAKNFFRVVKVDQSSNWFLPNEMIKYKKDLLNYRSKGYIDFEIKFNNIVCKTEVIICKDIK